MEYYWPFQKRVIKKDMTLVGTLGKERRLQRENFTIHICWCPIENSVGNEWSNGNSGSMLHYEVATIVLETHCTRLLFKKAKLHIDNQKCNVNITRQRIQ